MRPWWALLLLVVPAASGAILWREDAAMSLAAQAPTAQLISGDIGTPTIGASKTSATVTLGSLPPITANDILRLDSTDASWSTRIELVSQSGWGVTESITISLADGILTESQIIISLGALTKTTGSLVDLPVGATDTEIRVIGVGTGTVTFDVILKPDSQPGPVLRYRVTLTI